METRMDMTELDLYKFVKDNGVEYHWHYNEILMMPTISEFKELSELLDGDIFDDEGIEIHWKGNYVVIEMTDICEYYGIYYPERIFPTH